MRKLIEFDAETFTALKLLANDTASSIQELADEAFRDLLKKHGRPGSLKEALRLSANNGRSPPAARPKSRRRPA